MSLEPIREDEQVVEASGTAGETVPGTVGETVPPATGSVWWVELAFGSLCILTAAVFVLAHTAVGPFAEITVVYGTIPTVLYLVVVTALGVGFLRSGLR